jgi:DNA-binding MarR family transcriptional regulator
VTSLGSKPTPRARAAAAVSGLARASRILERASDELSLAHFRVLSAVADGDQRASRVAERLALGKPAVSAAVEALCARGLMARAGVSGDQRAAALSVTAEGAVVLERVEAAMIARLEELAAQVPDRDRLLDALATLGEAIERLRAVREARR